MMKQSKKLIFLLFFLSVFVHLGFLCITLSQNPARNIHLYEVTQPSKSLKIRKLGIESGLDSQNIAFIAKKFFLKW